MRENDEDGRTMPSPEVLQFFPLRGVFLLLLTVLTIAAGGECRGENAHPEGDPTGIHDEALSYVLRGKLGIAPGFPGDRLGLG